MICRSHVRRRSFPAFGLVLVGLLVPAVAARAQDGRADAPPASASSAGDGQAPAPSGGQTPPQPQVPAFLKDTEFGALVDVFSDYYSTKPSGDASLRNFDTTYGDVRVSMVQGWIAKTASADSRLGYNFKMNFGHSARMINFAEPATNDFLAHMEQGFVSVLAPVGTGLQIDFGKFVTQHGAEVIEAKDNWNYSRSLLFALAIPYYHMGLRATYAINDKVTVMANVTNGWNDVKDNNGAKTFGAQVALKPNAKVAIVQNYMTGPEQAGNDNDRRNLSDTIVTVVATPAVSLMANYDYGVDTLAGKSVTWQGLAGYAKIQAAKRLVLSPRFEWFEDPQGFSTGTAQTVKEVTFTGEVTVVPNLLLRIEYRHDDSDQPVFGTGSGAPVSTQNSLAFGFLYTFSKKY